MSKREYNEIVNRIANGLTPFLRLEDPLGNIDQSITNAMNEVDYSDITRADAMEYGHREGFDILNNYPEEILAQNSIDELDEFIVQVQVLCSVRYRYGEKLIGLIEDQANDGNKWTNKY